MKNSTLVLLCFMFFNCNVKAQKDFIDFGKISMEEMNMTVCPMDSNASAVILGDFGISRFRYTYQDGFMIDFSRHLRIKIFNSESFDKADFSFILSISKSGREEKITNIKGFTYNLKEGEIEKIKLSKENIFIDEVNKDYKLVKITMPAVQEGSVIDLTYSFESPFLFNLNSWVFQDEIPTLRSEYHVYMPEYFDYKNWIEGFEYIKKSEDSKTESYTYIAEATIDGGERQSGGSRSFDAIVYHWTYIGENIKAFKDEPYITQPSDYLSAVRFELLAVKFPWAPIEYYTRSWKDINNKLNENENFGLTLNHDMHLNEIGQTLSLVTDPVQKAKLAYNHIKNTIAWDGNYNYTTDGSIRNSYINKSGNSAEINLNLVALCKKAGLKAYPVLLSTRKHGKIRVGQAILSQFNHVIAAVIINEKTILLDATDVNCPFGLLPPQCLNDQGRLIDENEGQWVNLYNTIPYDESYLVNITIGNDLQMSGDISYKAADYAGVSFRKHFRSVTSQDEFIKEYEKNMGDVELSECKIQDIDSIGKPVMLFAKINFKEPIQSAGEVIYLTPKLIERMTTNIFKEENRQFPVDYNYPLKEKVMFIYTIPPGYVVEEMPKPLSIALPDNKGKYIFSIKSLENKIQMVCTFQVNQTVFLSSDYTSLKSFYDMIVAKEAEPVVLKKVQ